MTFTYSCWVIQFAVTVLVSSTDRLYAFLKTPMAKSKLKPIVVYMPNLNVYTLLCVYFEYTVNLQRDPLSLITAFAEPDFLAIDKSPDILLLLPPLIVVLFVGSLFVYKHT